jgi:hypothetical protein
LKVTKQNLRASKRGRSSPVWRHSSFIVLLVLVFALGFITHAQGWDRYLRELVEAFVAHPSFTLTRLFVEDQVPVLHVNMNFADYQYLLTQRERALRVGAHVIVGQDPAPATFIYGEPDSGDLQSVDVAFHLLEGPAEQFAGEQWPFQVARVGPVDAEQAELLDWRWATLVPAERAALLTWGYLAAAREASLPATRFNLVRLFINGKAWGLYALETLPSLAMLEACHAEASPIPPSEPLTTTETWADACLRPIVYFDREAYLEAFARLGPSLENGFAYAQPIVTDAIGPSRAERASSGRFVSTFEDLDSGNPSLDVAQTLLVHRMEALELLYQWQRGELAPSAVFDVDALAHFLALTTLWYGTPKLDWRAFYVVYDPGARHFVPIANGGMSPETSGPSIPLPRALLDDPVIQRAFLEALVELQAPAYLPRQQARLGATLEALRLASGADLGYPPSPWTVVAQHQARMQHMLNPPRTLFVDMAGAAGADVAFVLRLANLQPYPVEVLELDLGENAVVSLDPAWVDDADRDRLVDVKVLTATSDEAETLVLRALSREVPSYVHLSVPLTALPTQRPAVPGEIQVVTRLWGLDQAARVTVAVHEDYLQALCERSGMCEAMDGER